MTSWASLLRRSHPPVDGKTAAPVEPRPAQVRVVPDMSEYGFRQAGRCDADPRNLQANIQWIFHGNLAVDETSTSDLETARQGLQAIEPRMESLKNQRAECDQRLTEMEEALHQLRTQGAHALGQTSALSDRVGFVMAALITLMLTVYLYVFYVNAGYNAFVYEPTSTRLAAGSTLLVTAIFNPAAFKSASESSAALFLLPYPFVFLGLGHLLQPLRRKRQYFSVVLVFGFTLLFDALLAFEIVRKIYEARYLLGSVSEPWNASMIWTDMTFYLIMCSGFLVYVVWGLLTGFMWELIDVLDPRRSEKEGIKRQSEALTAAITDTEKHRDEIQVRITTLEKEVQGLRASFSMFHQLVRAFLSGWLKYITQAFGTPGEAERRAEEARKVADETVGFLVGAA